MCFNYKQEKCDFYWAQSQYFREKSIPALHMLSLKIYPFVLYEIVQTGENPNINFKFAATENIGFTFGLWQRDSNIHMFQSKLLFCGCDSFLRVVTVLQS